MSGSGGFCPRCGEERGVSDGSNGQDEATLPGETDRDRALCVDCYLEEYDLVEAPERVQVRVCTQCGAVHRGNRWVDVGAEDYTDVAIEEVTAALAVHVDATDVSWQVAPEQLDPNTIRMHCQFSGTLRGRPVAEAVTVPVGISRETCERCGRIAGGSYASIVQVRARERDPTDEETDRATAIAHGVVEDLEARGDREVFVTEVNEVAGGIDIRLSTNRLGEQVARRIVREFGGSYEDYETLVTEDSDGNEVYRVTFAVHLPPYRPGEVIEPAEGDGPVLVTSVDGNLKGTYLTSGDPYEASHEDGDAPAARRIGWQEAAESTTLVAVEDEHAVQVLDPETYESKTVPRPPFLETDRDAVEVLRDGDTLYIVPDSETGD